VDIELEYEQYFKNMSSDDTDRYHHFGYLLNRKGNAFYGKLTHCSVKNGIAATKNDTVIDWVQGVNAKQLMSGMFYSNYKTDKTLEPLFYQGINLPDIEKFIYESGDSQFIYLSCEETGHDNLGNNVESVQSVKIRRKDYVVIEYGSKLSMFGTEQYARQELLSIRYVNKDRKKELLKNLNNEVNSTNIISQEELNRSKIAEEQKEKEFLLKSGDVFPQFKGYFSDKNDSLMLGEIRDSIILLDYFFTTCGPCISAIPHLAVLFEKYKGQGLVIYGIDPLPKDTGRLNTFKKKFKIPYQVLKTSEEIPLKYHLTGYPTLFILNKEKRIIRIFIGYHKDFEKEVEEEVIKLLKS
jgi:thiol-disulfide isomerase/thioredoxin